MYKELNTTITVGTEDSPMFTYIDGHISVEEFNKAFENEGWKNGEHQEEDLIHGYYNRIKDKTYHFCKSIDANNNSYTKCTYVEW